MNNNQGTDKAEWHYVKWKIRRIQSCYDFNKVKKQKKHMHLEKDGKELHQNINYFVSWVCDYK